MTSLPQVSESTRASDDMFLKSAAMLVMVLVSFFAAVMFGASAAHEGNYSADHLAWRTATGWIWSIAIFGGSAALWAAALFGPQRTNLNVRALIGVSLFAAFFFLLGEAPSKLAFSLALAGSIEGVIFCGRHSWRTILLVGGPYLFSAAAIVCYLMFAPPNAAQF